MQVKVIVVQFFIMVSGPRKFENRDVYLVLSAGVLQKKCSKCEINLVCIAKKLYNSAVDDKHNSDLKLEIKTWLKANRRDYAWLAANCYVSESTVRNWMARKPIPKAKEFIIRQLIAQKQVEIPSSSIELRSDTVLRLKLDSATCKKLEAKAAAQGITLEEMLCRVIVKLDER